MKRSIHPLFAIACGLSIAASSAQADYPRLPRPLADYAGEAQACIALYAPAAGAWLLHGPEQCQRRLAPCSTFKVPNALAGLESGVLSGPGDRKAWDGVSRDREALNRDHDLASAMEHSVVWYFQRVARDIGPERMQAALDAYDYGNRDISGGQQSFWLSSSLEISAFEQVRFMDRLDRGALPASSANQATVRELIRQQSDLPEGFEGDLHGKTGTCLGSDGNTGWFVGFFHRDGQRTVFAVNLLGAGVRGWDARTLAIRVLGDLQ